MKVVIPDLVSNSYFPAIAAVEMGFFKEEGLDAELELIYPVGKCYEALRDGKAAGSGMALAGALLPVEIELNGMARARIRAGRRAFMSVSIPCARRIELATRRRGRRGSRQRQTTRNEGSRSGQGWRLCKRGRCQR